MCAQLEKSYSIGIISDPYFSIFGFGIDLNDAFEIQSFLDSFGPVFAVDTIDPKGAPEQ
jgi:hypothetical protein